MDITRERAITNAVASAEIEGVHPNENDVARIREMEEKIITHLGSFSGAKSAHRPITVRRCVNLLQNHHGYRHIPLAKESEMCCLSPVPMRLHICRYAS